MPFRGHLETSMPIMSSFCCKISMHGKEKARMSNFIFNRSLNLIRLDELCLLPPRRQRGYATSDLEGHRAPVFIAPLSLSCIVKTEILRGNMLFSPKVITRSDRHLYLRTALRRWVVRLYQTLQSCLTTFPPQSLVPALLQHCHALPCHPHRSCTSHCAC